jgi:predicted GIY-YIG superfamily endonuclease
MYYVYILRCADGSLYTGSTNDVPKRLAAHAEGRGAKYTRGRRPLALVYTEACADKPQALRREAAIKKLRRARKLVLLPSQITGGQ